MTQREDIRREIANQLARIPRLDSYADALRKIHVCKAPNGIPGKTGDTPGKATDVQLWVFDDTDTLIQHPTADPLTVYNTASEAAGANVILHVKQEGSGRLVLDFEECVTAEGFGNMFLSTTGVAGTTIPTAGFIDLDEFDSKNLEVGCTLTPATGTFTFEELGWWDLDVLIGFSHNEAQQGRTFDLQLWNVTDSTEAGRTRIGVPRNQLVTNWSGKLRAQITAADLSDDFRLRVGEASASAISSMVWDVQRVILTLVIPE